MKLNLDSYLIDQHQCLMKNMVYHPSPEQEQQRVLDCCLALSSPSPWPVSSVCSDDFETIFSPRKVNISWETVQSGKIWENLEIEITWWFYVVLTFDNFLWNVNSFVASSSSSSSRTLVFLRGSRTIEDFHKTFYLSITFRIQRKDFSWKKRCKKEIELNLFELHLFISLFHWKRNFMFIFSDALCQPF